MGRRNESDHAREVKMKYVPKIGDIVTFYGACTTYLWERFNACDVCFDGNWFIVHESALALVLNVYKFRDDEFEFAVELFVEGQRRYIRNHYIKDVIMNMDDASH